MTNNYTETWFDTFLSLDTAASVDPELDFMQRHIPLDRFPRILDVACGIGRHAAPLAAAGYDVTGIDSSETALEFARQASPSARFHCLDMYNLDAIEEAFDAVLCLWASFGYGTQDENQQLLEAMARKTRSGGRILLDVYQRDAVASLDPQDTAQHGSRIVSTQRSLKENRYRIDITYSDTADSEVFEWQVYTPSELCVAGKTAGLKPILTCSWFNEARIPSMEDIRMQILFERI